MNNQREILFRGFHPCEDGDTTIYVEGEAVKGRWVEGAYCCMGDRQQQQPHIISHAEDDEYGDWIEVIPSTVCQYTGFADKNVRKIFARDIATDGVYEYIVTFSEGAWVLKQTYSTGSSYSTLYHVAKLREVIGTIWDKERQDERD